LDTGLLYSLIFLGACIVLYVVVMFIFAIIIHSKIFNHRYDSPKWIKFYTPDEFNLNVKNIEFKVGKNTLRGGIYSYDNPKDDTVVVFNHGMWSGVDSYMQEIEYIARAGYEVVSVNYTATEQSDGKSLIGLTNGLKCVDYTIRYVKSINEYKNRKIVVVGHSWGAFNTLAVTKYHPDIYKVVAISPFINLGSTVKSLYPKSLHPTIPFTYIIEFMKCGKYAFANNIKTMKNYKGESLILHSTDDTMLKYDITTKLIKDKCSKPKYYIVNGKGHNPDYTLDAVARLKDFQIKMRTLSGEEKTKYIESLDFHKLGELDTKVMDDIVDFIK